MSLRYSKEVSNRRLRKKERVKKKESQSYAFSVPPVIAGKPKPAAPGTQWGRKLPQAIFEITACLRSHFVWLGPNCHCSISKSESALVFPGEKGGSGFTNKAAQDFSTGVCCRCLWGLSWGLSPNFSGVKSEGLSLSHQ